MHIVRWFSGLALAGVALAAWLVDRSGVAVTPLDWSRPTAIVVLGARVAEDGAASPTLQARVAHGVALAHAGRPALFVVSGGVGTYGPAEAEVGLALARRLGLGPVPTAAEAESHSTRQNAELTARLLRERGVRRVVVVSDPYHLPRARLEMERAGLEVQTSPVVSAPRHRSVLLRAGWTLREVVALARFGLRLG